jgi:predicted transcriptional regulator
VEQAILEDVFTFVGVIVAMGCFTGIITSWMKHRRGKQLASPDLMQRLDEIADRMNRIETAVDATAIEVERISEGQRFTTRLLADRAGAPALAEQSPGGSTNRH